MKTPTNFSQKVILVEIFQVVSVSCGAQHTAWYQSQVSQAWGPESSLQNQRTS